MAGFAPEVLALLASIGLQAPMGIGEKFYVNGGADGVTAGIDAVGRGSKKRPFLSIAYALTHCVSGRHDYIYCWNTNHQDEAASIVIPSLMNNVHIIGIAMPGCSTLELNVTGDYPAIIVNPGVLLGPARGIEIAGFNISGGATSGCIELDGACDMVWIHHCTFGHAWGAGGQDGIRFNGVSPTASALIEDNWFYGFKLTRYGVYGISTFQGCIRKNNFVEVPTCAIALIGVPVDTMVVEGNLIACGADALGNAIDLGASTNGCLVARNEAAHGSGTLMTAAPYHDAQGGDENHWMSNQAHDQFVLPDEVPS